MQQARQPKDLGAQAEWNRNFTSAWGRNRRTAMQSTLELTSNTALFLRDASTDRQRSWKRRLFTANTDGEGLVYDSGSSATYKPVLNLHHQSIIQKIQDEQIGKAMGRHILVRHSLTHNWRFVIRRALVASRHETVSAGAPTSVWNAGVKDQDQNKSITEQRRKTQPNYRVTKKNGKNLLLT